MPIFYSRWNLFCNNITENKTSRITIDGTNKKHIEKRTKQFIKALRRNTVITSIAIHTEFTDELMNTILISLAHLELESISIKSNLFNLINVPYLLPLISKKLSRLQITKLNSGVIFCFSPFRFRFLQDFELFLGRIYFTITICRIFQVII